MNESSVRVIQVQLQRIGVTVDTPIPKMLWDEIPVQFKGAVANKLTKELAAIEECYCTIPKERWREQSNTVGLKLAIRGVQRLFLANIAKAAGQEDAMKLIEIG
jgi:hypothetical protein